MSEGAVKPLLLLQFLPLKVIQVFVPLYYGTFTDTQNYCLSRFCPSSGILNSRKQSFQSLLCVG
jgi:hypothetical protein